MGAVLIQGSPFESPIIFHFEVALIADEEYRNSRRVKK